MRLPYEKMKALYEVEETFEWHKWRQEIPYINWPSDWLAKAIPPFSTGIIRYNIKHKDLPDSFVSVYLDCYDLSGFVGEPYWEIYPVDGDCKRCLMNETEELLAAIKKSLDQQAEKQS